MGFHRFIQAALQDRPILVYGDGEQTRDFTYVADAVEANWLALGPGAVGQVCNIGGGSRSSVNQVLGTLEEILGRPIRRAPRPPPPGDVRRPWADTACAWEILSYSFRVSLRECLPENVEYLLPSPLPPPGSVSFACPSLAFLS